MRLLTTIIALLAALCLRGVDAARRTTTPAPPPPPFQTPTSPCKGQTPEYCLSLMTTAEKIGQMVQVANTYMYTNSDLATYAIGSMLSGGGGGPSGAGGTAQQWAAMVETYQKAALNSRLKIPIIYGVDAVHGHNNVYGATIFPHNIGLGATANTTLAKLIGEATRKEVLATGIHWTFAPCIAVPRDDRWGRTYQGFSEDPTLAGLLGAAVIEGHQCGTTGVDGDTCILSTAKHFVADGGTAMNTGDSGYLMDQGSVQQTDAVIKEIHLAPYYDALDVGVGSVMVSYSSIYTQKMHGFKEWINGTLKTEMGFDGLVVSDWAGVNQVYPSDYTSSVAAAINAGIDMVMVPDNYKNFITVLTSLVNAGTVPMWRIDDAVLRILRAKYALNLFNNPLPNYSQYLNTVGSAEHRKLAREAVAQSMVLLKKSPLVANDQNGNPITFPLPLTGKYSIAIGGKLANDLGRQCGGWSISWQGSAGAITVGTTVYQGIVDAVKEANAANPATTAITTTLVTNAKGTYTADISIVLVGEANPYAEGRGDSTTLALPSVEVDFINRMCADTKSKACIVVVLTGRPVIIEGLLPTAEVWIAGWLPGTEGAGVADVLFGKQPFTGKLPVTWPRTVSQEPINDGDGKDYLYKLGHGLS